MSSEFSMSAEESAGSRFPNRFDRIYSRPRVMRVSGLNKSFPAGKSSAEVLRGISFNLHRREFISVIGPSGCGKSTLVRILAGLDSADSGELLLDDKPVRGPGPDRGMVFQGYSLFPWLTVLGNVKFGLTIRGESRSIACREARQWLSIVGLEEYADYYPGSLSGGMKQRVAIARALANKPRVLLMDEPFGALDAQTRARMQNYLLEIWKNINISIVFITHDLDEAVYLSDRIIVLQARPGIIAEIIENPVPRPRNREQCEGDTFIECRRHLESLIHGNESEEMIHIEKMTIEGDEVY